MDADDTENPSYFGNVVVHGVDVVDLAEFSRLVNDLAGDHLDRYFTLGELAATEASSNRVERLASRFAVKEAVLKALGTGWGNGIAFTDVEVVSKSTGAPAVILHRRAAEVASERGVELWLVSVSHAGAIAMASVIGLSSQR